MELQIFSKNVVISPLVENYVRQKLQKLVRHMPTIAEGKVEIVEERAKSPDCRFNVQITLTSGGILLRGEERARTIRAAVDSAVKALDRQIERYKGRLYEKGRGLSPVRNPSIHTGVAEEVEVPESGYSEELPKLVKVKRFAIKPMSVSEAIEQMELLGHSFFLFVNSETGSVGLLYKRNDGNYGLIEPELP